jgi:clan AA aspartic protease
MQIDGYFNANGEPAINLDLGTGAIEFLVDTGFAGGLILPNSLVGGLLLEIEGFVEFQTATAQTFIAPTYFLEVEWLGQRTKAAVAVSPDVSEALLGGSILRNCRLTIDYYDRTVMITRRN